MLWVDYRELNYLQNIKSLHAHDIYCRGVDNFLGLGGGGGGANKVYSVKNKRAAIRLKGEGAGGVYAPSCTKCRSKNFLRNS